MRYLLLVCFVLMPILVYASTHSFSFKIKIKNELNTPVLIPSDSVYTDIASAAKSVTLDCPTDIGINPSDVFPEQSCTFSDVMPDTPHTSDQMGHDSGNFTIVDYYTKQKICGITITHQYYNPGAGAHHDRAFMSSDSPNCTFSEDEVTGGSDDSTTVKVKSENAN